MSIPITAPAAAREHSRRNTKRMVGHVTRRGSTLSQIPSVKLSGLSRHRLHTRKAVSPRCEVDVWSRHRRWATPRRSSVSSAARCASCTSRDGQRSGDQRFAQKGAGCSVFIQGAPRCLLAHGSGKLGRNSRRATRFDPLGLSNASESKGQSLSRACTTHHALLLEAIAQAPRKFFARIHRRPRGGSRTRRGIAAAAQRQSVRRSTLPRRHDGTSGGASAARADAVDTLYPRAVWESAQPGAGRAWKATRCRGANSTSSAHRSIRRATSGRWRSTRSCCRTIPSLRRGAMRRTTRHSTLGATCLPAMKVRKIMRQTDELKGVAKDGVFAVCKSAELLVAMLTEQCSASARRHKRKTIGLQDFGLVLHGAQSADLLAFMHADFPPKDAMLAPRARAPRPAAEGRARRCARPPPHSTR